MINRGLFCKFKENKALIVSGAIIKKRQNLLNRNKSLNLFLNFGTNSKICFFSEKQLEKEINFLLNKIIQENSIMCSEHLLIIDIYLIIVKIDENLVPKCINCILLTLSSLEIKTVSLISNLFFTGYNIFNNLTIISFNEDKQNMPIWNIITSRIEPGRLICKIKAVGLFSIKSLTRIIFYSVNLKILIKFLYYSHLPIDKKNL
nr:hypothetical protein CcurKRNrm1_p084 [Cryptomonas curvata]